MTSFANRSELAFQYFEFVSCQKTWRQPQLAIFECDLVNLFSSPRPVSYRRCCVFRHRASSNLVGALVGADSSARDFAPTGRRRSFPGRRVRMGDRRNEPMELCPTSDRTASANHHPILCSSSCRFWLGRPVCARFRPPRIAVPCHACFARLLGGVRISYRDWVASQHMGQSRLHTNELPPCDPDRCGHRYLGNQLHCLSVCGRRGSFVERRGRTMATSRARSRCGGRHLRSVCFWQVAKQSSPPG